MAVTFPGRSKDIRPDVIPDVPSSVRTNPYILVVAIISELNQLETDVLEGYLRILDEEQIAEICGRPKADIEKLRLRVQLKLAVRRSEIRRTLAQLDPVLLDSIEIFLLNSGMEISLIFNKYISILSEEEKYALEATFKDGTLRAFLNAKNNTLPSSPPNGETYDSRPDKKENAPAFIRRVYSQWLTGGFTRADLRNIDPSAAIALNNYESHRGQKLGLDELNLPTKKQRNDEILSSPPGKDDVSWREADRIKAAARRRGMSLKK
ncbi:hypothetical protein MKK84_00340 [Methylobacterium sp. E-065]|uniref:hypothetical protein n=1 Tax=Methylobacterium sp. E-065 TaxID=2836583 RepID=UPI001FB8C374|nr:hypothetical protein [Methylobacterium sp. E-065]MCJ2015889.1 hypothetical protein [Methylobacterium sp. E-065]